MSIGATRGDPLRPLILDPADAAAAPATGGLYLTPAARVAAGQRIEDGAAAPFSDEDHAACAQAAERAAGEFDAGIAAAPVPEFVRVVGRQTAWQLAAIAHRIARSVPAEGGRVRGIDGKWSEARDRDAVLAILLPRVLEWGLAHRSEAARPPLAGVHRFLVQRQASRLAGAARWVMTPNRKLKLGLERELRAAGARTASLRPTLGGWGDYARLVRGEAEMGIAPLARTDRELRSCIAALEALQFSDPLLRSAWSLYRPYFEANIAAALAVLQQAPDLMKRLGATLAVAYEGNSWLAAAILEAARASGARSAVVNHNSHAKTGEPVADSVVGFFFRQRTCSGAVSQSAQWTPHWREWGGGGNVQFLPFRPAYPRAPGAGERFRILHAGNYQNWSDFIPWVAETSDEYVAGVRALAQAMAHVPDADLTVRTRSKPEVSPAVLGRLVPAAANVTVADTNEDFLEQMAASDLLVCHFSTTAEQALQMGKPVLLWGNTRRYCQFPASRDLPTAASRAPVYAVDAADRLPEMLMAIRAHHWKRPLTEQETARYRNRPEDPDLRGLAERLLSP